MSSNIREPSRLGSAGDRKVTLARFLAEAEVERLGLQPTKTEIVAAACRWQAEFGLEDPKQFEEWLAFAGMDMKRFSAMMWRFAALAKLLDYYEAEIDAAIPDHIAVHSVRRFIAGVDGG